MIGALAQWYGSNRMLAKHVGEKLAKCEWVGVPFAGGMCELKEIKARTMLVADKHCWVIQLAKVVVDDIRRPALIKRLESVPFHDGYLVQAQERMAKCEELLKDGFRADEIPGQIGIASDYFCCVWMTRSGVAGTKNEFNAGLSVRWESGGGDSVVRFRNAAAGLDEWASIMRRCTFICQDVFDFLDNVKDKAEHGLYLDPPFPGPGDKYKHRFTDDDHCRLATKLAAFEHCRIVCRFYDHPLVRQLYPEQLWEWNHLEGRKQTNAAGPEVLLVRKR